MELLQDIKKMFDEGESYKLNFEQIDWLIKQAEKVERINRVIQKAEEKPTNLVTVDLLKEVVNYS